jgi:hypothetical protein
MQRRGKYKKGERAQLAVWRKQTASKEHGKKQKAKHTKNSALLFLL